MVHHARREILLTHPFMIVGQIQVTLVVETKLALSVNRKSGDQYSSVNIKLQNVRDRLKIYIPYIPAPVCASRISDASSALRWISISRSSVRRTRAPRPIRELLQCSICQRAAKAIFLFLWIRDWQDYYYVLISKMFADTYVIRRNMPCHFCTWRQLTIDQTFNFTFRPPIVYIHYRDHVPLRNQSSKNISLYD